MKPCCVQESIYISHQTCSIQDKYTLEVNILMCKQRRRKQRTGLTEFYKLFTSKYLFKNIFKCSLYSVHAHAQVHINKRIDNMYLGNNFAYIQNKDMVLWSGICFLEKVSIQNIQFLLFVNAIFVFEIYIISLKRSNIPY